MPIPALACPSCRAWLPLSDLNSGRMAACSGCASPSQIEVFPALWRPIETGAAAQAVLLEGEAGCFYHPQKRAATHCESCGRFLCALCDVDLNGQHICPGCLETGQRKGRLTGLEQKRTLYDGAALVLASVPLLMWPLTVLTAPIAIGVAIYGWNKPGSLVPRTRIRALLAMLIGLLQIAGWGLLVYAIIQDL